MKIAHIIYGLKLGGIETMLVNIANEQVKHNHEVHIVIINNLIDKNLLNSLDSRIHPHCLKRKISSKNPIPIIKLNVLLKQLSVDIIHLHFATIYKFILPIFKNKICVTQHDVFSSKKSVKYLKKISHIYAISNVVKEDIYKETGLDSETVLNGIIPDLFKNKNDFETLNKFKIVQVGRLIHQKKGQHLLIEAINILKANGICNIEVSFIGEGESEKYLKTLVNKYKLHSSIHFLGAKSQDYIFQHLCNYNLLIQPSIFEGFGLTVAEGMAAKIPVLISKNQGPLEIIDFGKYGYYFENGSAKDCAEMIHKIMNSTDLIPDLTGRAYERVCQLYNVRKTALTYIEKYQEIIKKLH